MMRRARCGLTVAQARSLIMKLPGVVEGRSYGLPSFLVNGRFFARFRDHDTVLVVQLSTIDERDVLIGLDPGTYFFTDHYRDYPAVLVRLSAARRATLAEVLESSRQQLSALPVKRPARRRRAGARGARPTVRRGA